MANALMVAAAGADAEPHVPEGTRLRPLAEEDLTAVGEAYRRTYLGTSMEMTLAEATDDIRAAWRGEYGRWHPPSCFGAWTDDELAGAILTVTDAPWPEVPAGPFIIDLFVIPAARRRGIGRALVRAVQASVPTSVALRVDDEATAARALYESLGFQVVDAGEQPPR